MFELHVACAEGNLELVEQLLLEGHNPTEIQTLPGLCLWGYQSDIMITPLDEAAKNGHLHIAKRLLEINSVLLREHVSKAPHENLRDLVQLAMIRFHRERGNVLREITFNNQVPDEIAQIIINHMAQEPKEQEAILYGYNSIRNFQAIKESRERQMNEGICGKMTRLVKNSSIYQYIRSFY